MKLKVIAKSKAGTWYGDGLKFTCTQCGNCCTGGPGFVWISDEEVGKLAEYLKLSREVVLERYCREVFGRVSLKEHRNARGEYDCAFLKEERVTAVTGGEAVLQAKRGCSVYPVRPLQCRTWPFWDGNMASPEAWNGAAVRCHGMNRGRTFSAREMEALRDAEAWPGDPPTSAKR